METLESGQNESGQDPADAEPLVELTRIAKNRWQASFPEDVDELLGHAYGDLKDVLGAVAGVTNAFMEDRDLAIVDTRAGVTGEDLERNFTHALNGMLAGSDEPAEVQPTCQTPACPPNGSASMWST